MEKPLDFKDMYMLILNFYGNKITKPVTNTEKQEMTCIIYDSFVLKFSLDERTRVFGAGIILSPNQVLTSVLGERLAINNDEESVKNTLRKIDEYCRLRLSDKYLAAFENIIK